MIRVVLADANVLYSRVLRDYLLYAATFELIEIRWSAAILEEVVHHLAENISGFDAAAGTRLRSAMNAAFSEAQVDPGHAGHTAVADLALPDPDDRHVLAAAVAVSADVLCSDNVKDFPPAVMRAVGIHLLSADALLALLAAQHPDEMAAAHRLAVSRLPGATDESTLAALRRAGASTTAEIMRGLLHA